MILLLHNRRERGGRFFFGVFLHGAHLFCFMEEMKMKKSFRIIAVLLALVFMLGGCGTSETNETQKTPDETVSKPLYGVPVDEGEEAVEKYLNINDQNNVQNFPTFLEHNGWIYGQAWNDEGYSQLVKVRTDGTDWTVLDNGFAHHIYVVDNYIYYMNSTGDDSAGIYKMKTSGADKQRIAKENGYMQIVGREIYYTDYYYEAELDANGKEIRVKPEYCHLFKCDLNGNNVTEVLAKPTFYFYVFSDGILYQDDNDNASLHVCNIDGTNDTKLNDDVSYLPLYDGEYIYYVKHTDPSDDAAHSIWRIKPDGTEDKMVANYNAASGMIMTKEHIYFVFGDDSYRLYRIDKDGNNLTLITQDANIRFVQFVGGEIKYTKYTDDMQYIEGNFFCEQDGSGKWNFLDLAY